MTHVNDFMLCPKCHKKFLKQSVRPEIEKEFYCHLCHEYFGIVELVVHWGWDAGDFEASLHFEPVWEDWWFDEPIIDEPEWDSLEDRNINYEEDLWLPFPWDEANDIDYGYPIGQVGL